MTVVAMRYYARFDVSRNGAEAILLAMYNAALKADTSLKPGDVRVEDL